MLQGNKIGWEVGAGFCFVLVSVALVALDNLQLSKLFDSINRTIFVNTIIHLKILQS